MNLQSFSTSSFATKSVMALCKLPSSLGHRVGRLIADLYTTQKDSPLIRAVRLNQSVIRNGQISDNELDTAVRDVFRHAAHCYCDFYGNINRPKNIKEMVSFSPNVEALIQRSQLGEEGAMVVGPHMSNFDLIMLAIAHQGFRAQGISPEQPPGGYIIQNQIRESTGLEITPASSKTLQQAIDRMRNGGVVFTGIDRPVKGEKINPNFFGRPSFLPTGAIRMAMKAEVPVIVVYAWMNSDGKYHIEISEPIPMQKYTNRKSTIQENTETVLGIVTEAIRKVPNQWLMFLPVWKVEA
jgi:lauroyl/myristoyl acyltransferase